MTNDPQPVQQVETKFEPSNLCRTIHIDGAIGGVTPSLNVQMSVYSEHRAAPEGSTVSVAPDGTIQEKMNDDPQYLVREIEAHLVFGVLTAIALRDWLSLRINEAQTVQLLTNQKELGN